MSICLPGWNRNNFAMSRFDQALGLTRSLAIYYAIPGRAHRLQRFYSGFIRAGDLCFDIGSHVGNHSRCWLKLGARVVALEPQQNFARWLHWLFAADPHISVLDQAVAAAPGSARMQISARTPTVSTLAGEWTTRLQQAESFRGVNWATGPSVELTTLDALIERYGEPGFVKIDVEGYEARVLSGLTRPLRALAFEYIPATADIALACIERLGELGDYRYNRSLGEQYRFVNDQWLTADAICRFLQQLQPAARSGDIYARLQQNR
jgi:FkbM family methyltransferase